MRHWQVGKEEVKLSMFTDNTAELHAYCLLIAWFVSAQLFEYCLLRSLFGRHLPGTSPN